MQLNTNFDPYLQDIISLCKPLEDWFLKNQDALAYYDFTHKGCMQNKKYLRGDIAVLGKMADEALTWLEAPSYISMPDLEKAINAAFSIAMVYDDEKLGLTNQAKERYFLEEVIQ